MAELRLRKNKDGTISVRVGRAVEHIDAANKSKSEVFDAIKWAAISKGAVLSDVQIAEAIRVLHGEGSVMKARAEPRWRRR